MTFSGLTSAPKRRVATARDLRPLLVVGAAASEGGGGTDAPEVLSRPKARGRDVRERHICSNWQWPCSVHLVGVLLRPARSSDKCFGWDPTAP